MLGLVGLILKAKIVNFLVNYRGEKKTFVPAPIYIKTLHTLLKLVKNLSNLLILENLHQSHIVKTGRRVLFVPIDI